jgi:hypothetical protein
VDVKSPVQATMALLAMSARAAWRRERAAPAESGAGRGRPLAIEVDAPQNGQRSSCARKCREHAPHRSKVELEALIRIPFPQV